MNRRSIRRNTKQKVMILSTVIVGVLITIRQKNGFELSLLK